MKVPEAVVPDRVPSRTTGYPHIPPGTFVYRPAILLMCRANTSLAPEILEYIIDLLHNNQEALRECCLISKSWIPRTRKHLFALIVFPNPNILQSWKDTFPDPLSSPGYYTHVLHCSQSVVDVEAGDWIMGFSRIVHLDMTGHRLPEPKFSFVPFHGFSPIIKSLRADFPTSGKCGSMYMRVRADLGGHLKYSRRWSGVRAGVLLGAQGAIRRGENRGEL